jgi:hypothetical protein
MPFSGDSGIVDGFELFVIYFYCRSRSGHQAHDAARHLGIVEFYELERSSGQNGQARWLASTWYGGPTENAAVRERGLRNLAAAKHGAIYEDFAATARLSCPPDRSQG